MLEEGRRTGLLYVLESGTVEIIRSGVPVNTVSQPGAVFGELSVLLDQAHIATVRATAESRIRIVDDPMDFLRANPDAAMHIAILLAQRLSVATSYLVEERRRYNERQDHFARVDEVLASVLHLNARPHRAAGSDAWRRAG